MSSFLNSSNLQIHWWATPSIRWNSDSKWSSWTLKPKLFLVLNWFCCLAKTILVIDSIHLKSRFLLFDCDWDLDWKDGKGKPKLVHQSSLAHFSTILCKATKKCNVMYKKIIVHNVWKSSKMSHLNFWILAFSTNFCPIETDLSGNTVWPQALRFKKSPNWGFLAFLTNFWHSKCKRSSLRSQCWMRLFLWLF